MEKLRDEFFTKSYFTLGDQRDNDTGRFFKDSNELAKFIDKILDKYDDRPSVYHTGSIYRYFRNFKRVNRFEQQRGANEFNNSLEFEGLNSYIPSGCACFLKCINFIFKKDFRMEYFEIIQSFKRRTNFLNRCRMPEF